MKKIYLILLLPAVQIYFAQNSQLYYSGVFLNSKDKAQNFLKVYNKNTGIYELTDEKGFAIIAAKAYDTLVWNSGKNREVVSSYRLNELKSILEGQTKEKWVKKIYSKTYDSLVSRKEKDQYSIENSKTFLSKNSDRYFYSVRKLKQKNDSIYKLRRSDEQYLVFNGSFMTSVEIKNRNAVPRTQDRYVQGRSDNGTLVWRGPETGEMFSFGPDISTLGFDHQPYEYDQNGRLANLVNGISPASGYGNSLFKTTAGYNNQLKLNALIREGNNDKIRLSLDLGQQKDQMYFIDQFTITNSLKTKLNTSFKGYIFNFGFDYLENKATNTNRIGLFNRAYQNSLLTPVSFSNAQGLYLIDGLQQRSYSKTADNPFFLLQRENKYSYQNNSRLFSFDMSKRWGDFKLNLSQSYQNNTFQNQDQYMPSTFGYANGLSNQRTQSNRLYYSNLLGSYSFGNGDLRNAFSLNFILNDRKSEIDNSLENRKYIYQRTSQDHIFNYNLKFFGNDFEIGADLGNSFYISNTSKDNAYWLPKANVNIEFKDIFNWNHFNFKALGAYTKLSSEPDITRSYASYATTQLKAENAYQYFPIKEVSSFKDLSNINIAEWKTGWRLNYRQITLEGEYFNRKIKEDVFPIYQNNALQLKNLADHTYKGYELSFSYDNIYIAHDFSTNHKVSFFKYKNRVDRVNTGYNDLALSGFSDIYKTLTQGQVLGAVMGSYFERNAEGQVIIDEFGFPKKAKGMKVIADPTPDFVMKFSHQLRYKMMTLDINWEWKKGGHLWNGTQAVLDYYGRSQNSGNERTYKNYIFSGVDANGNSNHIPVDFYDPTQGISENRWSRYGYLGVAEDYVQKADYVRINSISLTGKFDMGNLRRALGITFYVNNILLWQANKGVDPNQNFYDTDNGRGLDFFNLPSYKTFGCMVSFQF